MAKQIIDIIQTSSQTARKPASGNFKVQKKKPSAPRKKNPKNSLVLKIISGVVFIIGVIVVLSFWSHLDITLTLAQKDVDFSGDVSVVMGASLDAQNKVIQAESSQLGKEIKETFSSTGKTLAEGKAKGYIWVFNAKNPPSVASFIAQTRFLSSDNNKIFKTVSKVNLPAGQLQNGKIVPSKTKVEVVASEAGEDYNIGPSKFSVPGLSGSAAYYSIWGESDSNMEGGFKKEVAKVEFNDIENAKQALQQKLKEQILADFQKRTDDGIVIFPEAVLEENFNAICSQKPGDLADNFECSADLTMKNLFFKSSDLRDLTVALLSANASPDEKLRAETLDFNFTFKNFDKLANKITITLIVKAKVAKVIDTDSLIKRVSDKNESDIKEIINKEYPQIEKFELKFWPFWIRKASSELNKIRVGVEYSQ